MAKKKVVTKKPKELVMFAVMVNDEMYPHSLCHDYDGASSYLSDARHAATPAAEENPAVIEFLKSRERYPPHVRVVRVVITDATTEEDE